MTSPFSCPMSLRFLRWTSGLFERNRLWGSRYRGVTLAEGTEGREVAEDACSSLTGTAAGSGAFSAGMCCREKKKRKEIEKFDSILLLSGLELLRRIDIFIWRGEAWRGEALGAGETDQSSMFFVGWPQGNGEIWGQIGQHVLLKTEHLFQFQHGFRLGTAAAAANSSSNKLW